MEWKDLKNDLSHYKNIKEYLYELNVQNKQIKFLTDKLCRHHTDHRLQLNKINHIHTLCVCVYIYIWER